MLVRVEQYQIEFGTFFLLSNLFYPYQYRSISIGRYRIVQCKKGPDTGGLSIPFLILPAISLKILISTNINLSVLNALGH